MSLGPQDLAPALDQEDRARADLYALLSRLYYGGPDEALLRSVARLRTSSADSTASALDSALQSLAEAAAGADAAQALEEYDEVFVGTGKAEVTPYASHYLVPSGSERLLVRLRQSLADLGLARKQASHEPEDHVAALFDVMRYLVLAGPGDAALQNQRSFFGEFIEPFYPRFCAEVAANRRTRFYKPVTTFARVFLDIDRDALSMI